MDLATFRAAYPEFDRASDDLVSAKLAQAAREVSSEIWDTWRDDGIGLLAAHYLATSPNGQMARLAAKEGSSVYYVRYIERERAVTIGLRCF